MRPLCPECRKKRYPTEEEANKQLIAIKRRDDSIALRFYQCSFCKGFHLTKQPQKIENKEITMKEQFEKYLLSNQGESDERSVATVAQ